MVKIKKLVHAVNKFEVQAQIISVCSLLGLFKPNSVSQEEYAISLWTNQ